MRVRITKRGISVVMLAVLLLLIGAGVWFQANNIVFGGRSGGIGQVSDFYDQTASKAEFDGKVIDVPLATATEEDGAMILGENSNNGDKIIKIDLTEQRLYAFEGNGLVYSFLISSGKWGKTPTGEFEIWGKFRYTKMEGGSRSLRTYYYLPNVPYVMFFANSQIPKHRGFGIHGTYWHNNFGVPMSHGCINMKTEEAELLYQWAQPQLFDKKSILASEDNPGTRVYIYGQYKAKGG